MRYIHISGFIQNVPEHLEHLYKDSPSWKKYANEEVQTELSTKQIEGVAKKRGIDTKKPKKQLVDELIVGDSKKPKEFDDDIV